MFSSQNKPLKKFDAKLKGLLEMIEVDFRQILTDSHSNLNKKKYPDVKEKLEIAIKWIQENKLKHPSMIDEHLTLLMDSFYSIVDAKVTKLYMQVFNILQRVVMTLQGSPASEVDTFKMSQDCRERILLLMSSATLSDQGDTQTQHLDDMQLIKILQIMMILMDPNQASQISKLFVNQTLQVCFQLYDHRLLKGASSSSSGQQSNNPNTAIIKSTLEACTNQLFTIIFESFKKRNLGGPEDQSNPIQDFSDVIKKDTIGEIVEDLVQNLATALFIHEQGDLGSQSQIKKQSSTRASNLNNISIIGGVMGTISNQHIWSFKPTFVTKGVLLEMLREILTLSCLQDHLSVFADIPKIATIFENQIIPTLYQMLKKVQNYDQHLGKCVIKALTKTLVTLCREPPKTLNLNEEQQSLEEVKEHSQSDAQNQSQNSATGYESSTSSKSRSQILKGSGQLTVRNLDQMLMVFAEMSDYQALISGAKDKEITSQNAHTVFQKMNWRQLLGLEAINVCFTNKNILQNLIQIDKGKSVQFALVSLEKLSNLITLIDHRHSIQMMLHGSQNEDQQFVSLEQLAGNNYMKQQQQQKKSMKVKATQSILDAQTVFKLVQDNTGNIEVDCYINPYHFQRVIQESLNHLVFQLDSILKQDNLSISERSIKEGLSPNRLKEARKMTKKKQQNIQEAELKQNEAIILIAEGLLQILEKAWNGIQCNYSLFQNEILSKIKDSQPLQKTSQMPYDLKSNFSNSWSETRSGNLFSFEEIETEFLIQNKSILTAYSLMINILIELDERMESKSLIKLRDKYVNSLCSLCTTGIVKDVRESPNTHQNQKQSHFQCKSDGQMININNLMACQTLIDFTSNHFQSMYTPAKKKSKQGNSNFQAHEQDVSMWSSIILTILMMDSHIPQQIQERYDDRQQNVKAKNKSIAQIDTSHLVDFNKIQRKIANSINTVQGSQDSTDAASSAFSSSGDMNNTYVSAQKQNPTNLQKVWNFQTSKNDIVVDLVPLKLLGLNQQNWKHICYRAYYPNKQDLVVLRSNLDKIIIQTQFADKMTMFQFCGAFQRVLSELVSNGLKVQNIDQELDSNSLSIQLIKRLMELVLVNLQRIELIWDQFLAMTNTLLQNQKSVILKKLSIETNQAFIQNYFQYKRSQKNLRKSLKNIESVFKENSESKQVEMLAGDQNNTCELMTPADASMLSAGLSDNVNDEKLTLSNAKENISSSQVSDNESGDFDSDEEKLGLASNIWTHGCKWQAAILQPLTNVMMSVNNSDKLVALKSLEKIIQLCGQSIKDEGWSEIISNLSIANQTTNQEVIQGSFKCLKLIISNYVSQFGQDNFVAVFNCIEVFATSENENINANLTAIAMFMNVADYTAKLTREANKILEGENRLSDLSQQRKLKIDVDYIWSNLFQKMYNIGSSGKAEIRRSLIQTLENIVINHGQIFSEDIWNQLMKTIFVGMFKHSTDMFLSTLIDTEKQDDAANFEANYNSVQRENQNDAQIQMPDADRIMMSTPAFGGGIQQVVKSQVVTASQRKKMAFDDETVMKALKENDDQSWSETCQQLISSNYRAISMHNTIYPASCEDDSIWNEYHQLLASLIIHPTDLENGLQQENLSKTVLALIIQIFKSWEDFMKQDKSRHLFTKNFHSQVKILQKCSDWAHKEIEEFERVLSQSTGSQYFNRNKSLVLKLTPDVVSSLSMVFSKDVLDQIENKSFVDVDEVFKLVNVLKLGCKQVGVKFQQFGKHYKLLNEEQLILTFLEDFNYACSFNHENQLKYFENLFKMMQYNGDSYSEAYVKRVLSIINSNTLRGQIQVEVLSRILPQYLEYLIDLLELRYNWNMCKTIVFQDLHQNQDEQQLQNFFLYVGLQLICFSSYIIDPKQFKIKIEQSQEEFKDKSKSDQEFSNNSLLLRLIEINEGVLKNPANINVELYTKENKDNETLGHLELVSTNLWSSIVPCLKNSLIFNIQKYDNQADLYTIKSALQASLTEQEESLFIQVVKISQTLDMYVMNFVVNHLLPCCGQIPLLELEEGQQSIEQELISIVDNGSQSSILGGNTLGLSSAAISQSKFLKGTNILESKNFILNQNLSKYCLFNLFEICKFGCLQQDEEDEKIISMKKKISEQTLPILIVRCKDMLSKYIKDEQRSGSTKLPQNRVFEVIFILKEIQNLTQSLGNSEISKNLLIKLMPTLSEMIVTESSEIREHLKKIFIQIHSKLENQ